MKDQSSLALARQISSLALSKKASGICLMDLKALSTVTDYFVICHGDADLQVKAIADAVVDGMTAMGVKPWHKEGYDYLNWVLLDYVDVVVHIFQKETRDFYRLEKLWGDAPMEWIDDGATES